MEQIGAFLWSHYGKKLKYLDPLLQPVVTTNHLTCQGWESNLNPISEKPEH